MFHSIVEGGGYWAFEAGLIHHHTTCGACGGALRLQFEYPNADTAQGDATSLWCDNSGAVAIGNDAGSLGRSKHIARRARFLTEALGSGEIRLRHVAGAWQLADVLTKPLERRRFVTLTEHMMNTPNLVVTEGAQEAGDGHEQGKQADILAQG